MEGGVLAVCVLGALAGGICAARRSGTRPLAAGLGVGAVLFLLLMTAGLIACEGASVANGASPSCAPACAAGPSPASWKKTQEKTQKMIEIIRAML